MENEIPTTALESESPQASDAATASAPLEPTADSTPVVDDAKRERDRLAQAGRERAEAQRRAAAAESLVAQQAIELQKLRGEVASVQQYQTAQQQAEQEARLNALPPVERTAAELRMLKEQLAARDAVAYQERRTRELVQQANEAFGLNGNLMIKGNEPELDISSEQAFVASLRAYGSVARRLGATQTAPVQTEEEPVAEKKAPELSIAEQVKQGIEEGMAAIQREMGIGRSNAPRAAASGSGDAETISTGLQNTVRSYDNRRPGATREALRKAADEAASLAPGGRRR